MRPFTICYSLMTLTLGSMAAYAVTSSESLRSPFGDCSVFASNSMAESQPTVVLPPKSASESHVAPAKRDVQEPTHSSVSPSLAVGMEAHEVRALIGEPERISDNGARWMYGSNVLIFSNERLVGHVEFDPVQAALNKFNHAMAVARSSDTSASSSKSSGPKILTAMNRNPRSHQGYLNRPIAAGSARNAYRYDRNRNEYSYYMNRHGPIDRIFSGKRFLPRGMTTTTERSLGQQYLNYGTARYSVSPSTQYRR